jgi:Subtilase family
MPEPDRNWPRPFPELGVDQRPADQQAEDARRNQEQVALLMSGGAEKSDRGDELIDLLDRRRREQSRGVVRFNVEQRGDRSTLVVPNQIVLRRDADRDDFDATALRILREAGFTETLVGDDRTDCEELLGRVSPFTGPPGLSLDDVLRTVDELTAAGFSAAPTAVVALHQGPTSPPPIVVKSITGPSPTKPVVTGSKPHSPTGNVVVAVIDTGITEKLRGDDWLNEVPRTPDSIDPLDVFGLPVAPNGKLDFAAGHGTFAAGVVRHVDPEAEIRVYTALDSDGLASEVDVACAMVRAVKDGAHVVNLSLGMRTLNNQPCLALESALDLIDEMSEGSEPPVLVASAGNYGDTDPVWPAASRRVVSVAGLTANMDPAGWSSRGVWVDCSTVAEGIVSTFVEGEEDPDFGGHDSYPPDAWAVWTGTSFAAPQIAGAISRTCREEGLSPREAARRLIRRGLPIPDYGRALYILPGS